MKKVILFGSNKKIIVQQNVQKQIFKKEDIHTPHLINQKHTIVQQNLLQQNQEDQNLINYPNQIQQFILNEEQIQEVENTYKKSKKQKESKQK